MSLAYPASPRGRFVHLVDALLVVWAAVWIVMGVAVYRQVRGLTTLSDTLDRSATAIDQTASALVPLEQLPFVGSRVGDVVEQIRTTARSAHGSAESSRGNARFSVALAPTVPLVGLYVPFRVSRVKEVRAVRRALKRAVGDPDFEEFLARRAAEHLPFHRLREVSSNPWRDLEHGEYRGLARAELARLGIVRGRRALSSAPGATSKDDGS